MKPLTTSPLLSIIMPAFNAAEHIRDSIESVLRQEYQNFELLILDDGSEDSTIDVARRYNDSRVIAVRSESNNGVSWARNRLLDDARGEFITFLDADDVTLKGKYSYCLSVLMQDETLDMVGSFVQYVDESLRPINFMPNFEAMRREDVKADLLFGNTLATSSVVFKRRILSIVRFNESMRFAEDYELWSRLAARITIENVGRVFTKYRTSSYGATRRQRNEWRLALDGVHAASLARLGVSVDSSVLENHNGYLWQKSWLEGGDLDAVQRHYDTIMRRNEEVKLYERHSLKKAIQKSWFRQCVLVARADKLQGLVHYWTHSRLTRSSSVRWFFYLVGYALFYRRRHRD